MNMTRKVFISVLGTGYYGKCRYKKNNFISTETRYIQQATLEMLQNDGTWTDNDTGLVLLTDKARISNWQIVENKRRNPRTGIEEVYTGLEKSIKNLRLPFLVEGISIPDCSDENEIWQIFDILFSKLHEGDILYFDITHGFRYLPMLVLVLGNYAKFLKKVTIGSITYGNYETRYVDNGVVLAPIIDVTALSTLQDWTFSGAIFLDYGKVRNLTDSVSLALCNSADLSNRLKESVRELNKNLNIFEQQIKTCRGHEILNGNIVIKAKKLISKVSAISLIPTPLKKILDKISDAIAPFGESGVDNLCSTLKWCKKYRLIQQGYTLCQESIVTYICMQLAELNPYKTEEKADRKYRDFWSAILGMSYYDSKNESKWKGKVAENRELSHMLFEIEWVRSIRKNYEDISRNRNQINHAGFIGKVSAEEIINAFDSNIDKCISFLNEELTIPEPQLCTKKNIFINLSNHPSCQWTKEQIDAANLYGDIVDMKFPQVNPDNTTKELSTIADNIVEEICSYRTEANVTAHIMGEMGLTFMIVKRLMVRGIHCVCSTSYRIVGDKGGGKRLVEFHFNKFRDYE